MFLPGPSIPAGHRLGSLLLLQSPGTGDPAVVPQGPAGAQTGLGRAGRHLCFGSHTGASIAFGGVKHPCHKMGVCMPPVRDGRREGRVSPPLVLLMVHPSSTPPVPAARLQKSSSILGNGEKSELGLASGWNRTTSRLGGKLRGFPTRGFSFPENTQIMLVFGSDGRKTAGERKEKGSGAGEVRLLVL